MAEVNVWPKTISVDKRIVRILSASTYDNFPNALKEMITNSYDADADAVELKVDINNEIIKIDDTGVGMSDADFSLYLRIAGQKKERKIKTPSGRFVIGQFGVGFLAVFPFFKNFSIESKKANSDEVLYADIPCHLYFGNNAIDIGQIKVQGGVKRDRSKLSQQYTKIKLSGFTGLTKDFFKKENKVKPSRNSILNKPGIEILKWRLTEDLPLRYEDETLNAIFDKFTPNLPFDVKYNGESIFRKSYGKEVLEIHKGDHQNIGKIKFRYFIATDRKTINNPPEGKFLKIRNLNVGVGDRTGLGVEVGGGRSRLHMLTGEVHIIEGLNDLITVSRDKFNYDPDYEELKGHFIKKLAHYSTQLEQENEISNFVENTKNSNTIKNIKLLDPKKLSKKIAKLEKGKEEKRYIADTVKASSKTEVKLNSAGRRLPSKAEAESFEKKITINGVSYTVILESWDFKKEFYPACRIEGEYLYINSKYPLFKGTKHTDIFIKLHVLLINNLNQKIINRAGFEAMVTDILDYCNEYI